MSAQVLLVEDDECIRESLVELVEAEGYRVATACNGQDALTWLTSTESPPGVILLDLMMPVMDGLEFLEHLRALDGEKRDTPVIVLTASRQRPEGPGIIASMRKPIDLEALLSAMRSAVSP